VAENELTPEAIDLSRRAVAAKGWRWLPRMVDTDGNTYLGGDRWVLNGRVVEVFHPRCDVFIPDLSDPATVGCLLALVREAWGENNDDRFVNVQASSGGVDVLLSVQPAGHIGQMPEETVIGESGHTDIRVARGEALVAALEAAP